MSTTTVYHLLLDEGHCPRLATFPAREQAEAALATAQRLYGPGRYFLATAVDGELVAVR